VTEKGLLRFNYSVRTGFWNAVKEKFGFSCMSQFYYVILQKVFGQLKL